MLAISLEAIAMIIVVRSSLSCNLHHYFNMFASMIVWPLSGHEKENKKKIILNFA